MASFGVLELLLVVSFVVFTSSAAVEKGGIINEEQGQLVFSHILYRHGDRPPTSFYPNDLYNNRSEWPVGFGQLSNTGKTQQYELGKWLRSRYDESFLPKRYCENNIYVRAADVDRTIDSALCNLAGLYPPSGNQIWNKTIHWQPIPVHIVPGSDDWILNNVMPSCPVYEKELAQVIASPNIQNVLNEYQTEIDYVLINAGESLNASSSGLLDDIRLIRDILFVETLYNKTLPDWTKSIYPSSWLDEITILHFTLPSFTPALSKFRTGYILKEILDRSMSKVNGTLSPDISVYQYSAHDINISSTLVALGMFDNQYVQYAAALLFEVRVHENVPYLEIFYKRSVATKTPELLFIPNCGYSCPLTRLYELYANILPTNDFHTECTLKA